MAESESGQKDRNADSEEAPGADGVRPIRAQSGGANTGVAVGRAIGSYGDGPKMMETFRVYMIGTFQRLGTMQMNYEAFLGHFGHFMTTAGTLILPVMAAGVLGGLIGSGTQSQFRASPKAIEPKFSKLSPFSGFKRIFSSQSLAKLVVSLMKFVVIFGFTYPVLKQVLDDPVLYRHRPDAFWRSWADRAGRCLAGDCRHGGDCGGRLCVSAMED